MLPFLEDADAIDHGMHVRFWQQVEGDDSRALNLPAFRIRKVFSATISLRGNASGSVLAIDPTSLIEEVRQT